MNEKRTVRDLLKRVAPVGLAASLVFAATQAHAWGYYGGYNGGYSRHYGGYSRHYGGYSRYYGRYGYNGYRGGYYGGGYRGYRGGRYYSGYPYLGFAPGGSYSGNSNSVPSFSSPGSTYNGESRPAPQGNSDALREIGPGGVDGSGWAQLADGQYTLALSAFAAEATSQPKTGRPKVGYALSAAAAGDLRRGVWAMRRALEIDPDSLHYLTVDESLRPRIEQLITRYQTNPDLTSGIADAAFMLASLHYLLGNANSARGQADLAVAAGDRRSSTVNLERLIDKEIDANPQSDAGKRISQERKDAIKENY